MKSRVIFALIFCSVVICQTVQAQWLGGTGTTTSIYRTGNVGLGSGATSTPSAPIEITRLESVLGNKNVMLKLSNVWNGNAGAYNEPTILMDNGQSTSAGWAISTPVAENTNALPTSLRIGYYTNNTFPSPGYVNNVGKTSTTNTYTEFFRIDRTGKTIIGDIASLPASMSNMTLTPNYRLYVTGGIRTEAVQCDVKTAWPDFVFEEDYKLKDLKYVKSYINSNHHLPGIPNSAEVKTEGINVTDMQAQLLLKIEELTLYVIQLNEKNELLNKEISSLKEKMSK